jgi:hypothetical protein
VVVFNFPVTTCGLDLISGTYPNRMSVSVVPLITYFLTPWSRVLLEKLTCLKLVKKFPAFYGTRRFITAFTSARHLSLSWANPIQSIPPDPCGTQWRKIALSKGPTKLGAFCLKMEAEPASEKPCIKTF